MPTKKKPVTTGRAKAFIIDREKWSQGKYLNHKLITEGKYIGSQLCDINNMKCCLGFYASACGAQRIKTVSTPAGLELNQQTKLDGKFFKSGLNGNSRFGQRLMGANDNKRLSDVKREQYVKEKFASIGVKVKFIGKYPYAK